METLVQKGLTKSIGICNYNVQLIMSLLSFAKIKPVVCQFELHPYLTQPGLVRFCKINQIQIMAYNTMGKNYNVEKFHKDSGLNLISDKTITDLANKYGKTPGVILLNWAVSLGYVVIPSTSNPERFKENLECLNFKMSNDDIEIVSKLNIPYRFGSCQGDIDFFA